MRDALWHILSIKFAVILSKYVNVAMATILLRHTILIKCCKAPWQQRSFHLKG